MPEECEGYEGGNRKQKKTNKIYKNKQSERKPEQKKTQGQGEEEEREQQHKEAQEKESSKLKRQTEETRRRRRRARRRKRARRRTIRCGDPAMQGVLQRSLLNCRRVFGEARKRETVDNLFLHQRVV